LTGSEVQLRQNFRQPDAERVGELEYGAELKTPCTIFDVQNAHVCKSRRYGKALLFPHCSKLCHACGDYPVCIRILNPSGCRQRGEIKEIQQRGAEFALLERASLEAIKLPAAAYHGKHAETEEGGKAGALRSKRSHMARPDSDKTASLRIWAFIVVIFLILGGWLFFRYRRRAS
jgi:hypothetical protein